MDRTWLKELREERGLTCKDVADRVGISESYYWLIENGKRQTSMDVQICKRLSEALNVDFGIIITQEVEYARNRAESV